LWRSYRNLVAGKIKGNCTYDTYNEYLPRSFLANRAGWTLKNSLAADDARDFGK